MARYGMNVSDVLVSMGMFAGESTMRLRRDGEEKRYAILPTYVRRVEALKLTTKEKE
jgi:hypothetical protein